MFGKIIYKNSNPKVILNMQFDDWTIRPNFKNNQTKTHKHKARFLFYEVIPGGNRVRVTKYIKKSHFRLITVRESGNLMYVIAESAFNKLFRNQKSMFEFEPYETGNSFIDKCSASSPKLEDRKPITVIDEPTGFSFGSWLEG